MKLGVQALFTLGAATLGVFAWLSSSRVAPSRVAGLPATPEALASAPQLAVSSAREPLQSPPPRSQPAVPTVAGEEAAFMSDLRVLGEMDPELAIERAGEAKARFGDSADAPERRSILIHALSRVGRASEARGEAERMVNECPDSAWVSEIERFTGAHRHRNIRLAANGQLEYE